MQGFYDMQYTAPETAGQCSTSVPLLHSIHNTAKPTIKVALVPSRHYENAVTQLFAIHSILASYIPQDYFNKVFIESQTAGITGQQIDSISWCNSAAYAAELLDRFNPQDGDEEDTPTTVKRFRPVPLSYAAVTSTDNTTATTTATSQETISTVTPADLDLLFEKMKTYVAGSSDISGINIEELENRMSLSTKEVQTVREQLSSAVSTLTTCGDNLTEEVHRHNTKLSDEIQRQNVIILGMQQQFQDTMSDFSHKLQAIYNTTNGNSVLVSPPASTSKPGQRGDQDK